MRMGIRTAMAKELTNMQLNELAQESVRIVSDCADHLLGLVNDVLDLARIETKYASGLLLYPMFASSRSVLAAN